MKYVFVFAVTLLVKVVVAQEMPESASVVFEKAQKRAKAENKKIFIMFHASWCGWCHRMDDKMNLDETKELFSRNFVIEHLTVLEPEKKKHLENPGAKAMMDKYKGGNSGIPFWLVFDHNGNLLEDSLDGNEKNVGCPATEGEVKEFIRILSETTDLNKKELGIVERVFKSKD